MHPISKLRSKRFRKVIEVRVPVRFYWTEKGFDGIEIGPFKPSMTPYQFHLCRPILEAVGGFITEDDGTSFTATVPRIRQDKTPMPIPKVFLDAFRRKVKPEGVV